MKKIAAVVAGLALSSFSLADPMAGAIQGSGAASGGVNAGIQQEAQPGGDMGSVDLKGQAQGELQGTDEASGAIFTALDQNRDGALDESEAKSERSLNQYFAAVDTNADGAVSREEYLGRWKAIQEHQEEAE